MRECIVCRQRKPLDAFQSIKGRYHRRQCFECRRTEQAARYARFPARRMISRAKCRANAAGIPFAITEQDLLPLPTHCPVLGIPIRYSGCRRNDASAASLDRIHNHQGYVPGNVVIVSYRANGLKGDASPQELRRLADFYSAMDPVHDFS